MTNTKQEKIIGHASPIFIVFAILFSGFDLFFVFMMFQRVDSIWGVLFFAFFSAVCWAVSLSYIELDEEKIVAHLPYGIFLIYWTDIKWVETDASVLLASVENHKEEYLANQGSCIPGDDHIVLFFPPYREDCRFVFFGQNKRLVISSNQFSLSGSDIYIYLSDMINSHRIEVRKKIFVPLKHINTRVKK